jgi:hypothetical protein
LKNKTTDRPWDVLVKRVDDPTNTNGHIVDIRMILRDNRLLEKLKTKEQVEFSVSFQKYWFKKGIKSARIHRGAQGSLQGIKEEVSNLSTHMRFSFDSAEKAILFERGIESALDIFMMEQILEDKQEEQ